MDANYWNDEKVWVFWGCCALVALFAYVALRFICKRCKKVTVQHEDKDPIKYQIDRFNMTYEGAMAYYYKEIDRGRIKSTLHLTIIDTEHNDNVMFNNYAYLFYDKIKPINHDKVE